MEHFTEHAFLFLGSALGLVIVVVIWALLITITVQEIVNVFRPSKDEQREPTEWMDE